jgi:methionyl-tRNA synthetase
VIHIGKILVTSALPYVNNEPHLGNLLPVLSADVFARYCRMMGKDILYICGTDEHGTTTETIALKEGLSPQAVCDKYHAIHADFYRWLDISFDYFGRTSRPAQHEITQDIFLKLYKNGYIIEKELDQTYCPRCEKFLADRFVEGTCPFCGAPEARGDQCDSCGRLMDPKDLVEPRCVVCNTKPEIRKSRHLFLDLPQFEKQLVEWINSHDNWSANAKTFSISWLHEGLEPRCITRDLKWGVPVPLKGWEDKVFYVWFDAPIGYISITKEYCDARGGDWRAWWKNPDVLLYQFMGKDNIPFHTIIFPATLMGTRDGYILLHQISVNEYLTYEGGKFSKSHGRGVFATDAKGSGIPADVWRYYIFINRPEKQDTDFLWEDFMEKTNAELVGNLGNFVYRTLSFVDRYLDSYVSEERLGKREETLLSDIDSIINEVAEEIMKNNLKNGLKLLMGIPRLGNQYFQESEPWKHKDTQKRTLFICTNIVAKLGIVLAPYLPQTSKRLLSQLGIEEPLGWDDAKKILVKNRKIETPKILFEPLEEKFVSHIRERLSGKSEKNNGIPESKKSEISLTPETVRQKEEISLETKPEISYEEFEKLDLRVGEIKKVEDHPSADKLIVMEVDIGEKRTLVAGLKEYYKKEELVGKKIVILTNLAPRKLRGIESRGMLLAADAGKVVSLLTVDKDVPVGSKVR